MALFLQPDVFIAARPEGPLLARRGVPVQHRLKVGHALALSFLAATGDAALAADCCNEVLGLETGSVLVRSAVERYWTYLGDAPSRRLPMEWIEALDARRVTSPPLRQAAPASVTWLVTMGCNRRCRYCFYEVTYHRADRADSPPDATFPLRDVLRLLGEMGRIGTADLYLTGGEPLLRRDLVEIIAAASSQLIRTHLVTKYPVKRELARELASAGLGDVTLSLDDARPKQAAGLVGAAGYLKEATSAIAALLEQEIPLKVNAVATTLNIEHLDGLVQLVVRLGVQRLEVSPLVRPIPVRLGAKQLRPPSALILSRRVETLRQLYGDRIEIEIGGSVIPEVGAHQKPCGHKYVCDVGINALDILPDGRVTRCRYLPDRSELVVGSLRTQSLLEIWNSQSLASLLDPDPGAYHGTGCSGCSMFGACNQRGRCYYTALKRSSRIYAPDAFCPAEHAQ